MVNCEQVRKELSNFIDGEIDLKLRDEIVAHLSGCRRCSVLVDSLRKVIYVVGDERVFELPVGYSERLHRFLDEQISAS
jgi:anti-sigma factor RsiW